MSLIVAAMLGMFGSHECTSDSILPDDSANEYAGMTALEVAALLTRLAHARRGRQVSRWFLHTSLTCSPACFPSWNHAPYAAGDASLQIALPALPKGKRVPPCATALHEACAPLFCCLQAAAAAGSTHGEPCPSSALAHSAPTCWEDEHNSNVDKSSSSSAGNSSGSGAASSNVQEAKPSPVDACRGLSSTPVLNSSPCSVQQHAAACTGQVGLTDTCARCNLYVGAVWFGLHAQAVSWPSAVQRALRACRLAKGT